MIWEIVNPSDACTIEAPTLEAAALACTLLGNGKYALDPEDGNKDNSFPFLMFQKDPENFWKERFGHTLSEALETQQEAIIAALQSVLYGTLNDRSTFFRLLETVEPDKQAEFRHRWNDGRRSSMNDIGGRAMLMAEKLAERAAQAVGKGGASDGE